MFLLPVSRELPVEEEIIQTQLHSRTSDEYYTYSNVPWKLYMRKEVCFYLSFFLAKYKKWSCKPQRQYNHLHKNTFYLCLSSIYRFFILKRT